MIDGMILGERIKMERQRVANEAELARSQAQLQKAQAEAIRLQTERLKTQNQELPEAPVPSSMPPQTAGPTGSDEGVNNGRTWKSLNWTAKVFYVEGFLDGMTAAEPSLEKTGEYVARTTVGELVAGIDDIYNRPENARLMVIIAIRVFTMKVHGVSPALIEERLAHYRRTDNSLVNEPK